MDKEWFETTEGEREYDVGFDPFHSFGHFPYDKVTTKPNRPDRLFKHMKPFFLDAARAIGYLGQRLKVEAVLGDYVEAAEKMQFGLYDDQTRPKGFPKD